VLQAEVRPCAPGGETDGGTASQLIRGVRPTCGECDQGADQAGTDVRAQ